MLRQWAQVGQYWIDRNIKYPIKESHKAYNLAMRCALHWKNVTLKKREERTHPESQRTKAEIVGKIKESKVRLISKREELEREGRAR